MKNIQPIYATFELSKLLKEKEWQQRTKMVWLDFLGKQHLREVNLSLELNNAEYDAPEQWQIVEWLRVKHGIWIYLIPAEDNKNVYKPFFRGEKIKDFHLTEFFNSPQEAYSAAFDYILKKLI
jgi:hypothetical protein